MKKNIENYYIVRMLYRGLEKDDSKHAPAFLKFDFGSTGWFHDAYKFRTEDEALREIEVYKAYANDAQKRARAWFEFVCNILMFFRLAAPGSLGPLLPSKYHKYVTICNTVGDWPRVKYTNFEVIKVSVDAESV